MDLWQLHAPRLTGDIESYDYVTSNDQSMFPTFAPLRFDHPSGGRLRGGTVGEGRQLPDEIRCNVQRLHPFIPCAKRS